MNQEREAVVRATGLIVLSSLAFGSLSTLTVLILRSGLPLLTTMVWRYLLAAIILLLALRTKGIRSVSRNHALRLMLVGGMFQSVITYASLRALDYLPVGPLAFLFYTYPAWVVVIAALLGREKVTIERFVALSLAMAGIAVMVGAPSSASLNVFGVFLALGIALLYAIYLPVLHRVQEGASAAISSFYLISGVLIAFLVTSSLTCTLQVPDTGEMWRYIVMMSLFSTVIAFATLVAGLRTLGPVRTSIVATIEPFFTLLLGALFLGERITTSTIAGGVLIASAVILIQVTAKDPAAAEAVS
jgi:drug/metabolite transporter (DMT)-like permease